MIPPLAPIPAPALLTAIQERDLAQLIRTGRRARLLAQRHVARHGLDGAPPRTLQDIGQQFGLTRERVRQVEAKALTRLRDPALRHWLADDATPAAS